MGTRIPELAVYCSVDGDTVGICGGVKEPCGGGDPPASRYAFASSHCPAGVKYNGSRNGSPPLAIKPPPAATCAAMAVNASKGRLSSDGIASKISGLPSAEGSSTGDTVFTE